MTKVVTVSADELADLIRGAVADGVAAAKREAAPVAPSDREPLSVPEAMRVYGIGRLSLMAAIRSGQLPAVLRVMRGGRKGYVMRRSDCDRVLLGAR